MTNGMISILPLSTSHIYEATSHYHLQTGYTSLNWFNMQGPAVHTISFWVGLQGFLQSRLMSAFRKFYGRYNDLIYNYLTCCPTFFIPIVRPYLAHWLWKRITPHFMISRRVWSINRGCLLLLSTWSHFRYIWGSVSAHLFLWLVIPTCVLRLITLWYLSHFIIHCTYM
jgi:hypothetical protein